MVRRFLLTAMVLLAATLPAFGVSGRLKQSTAATIIFGPMVDKDDGVTPMTGLTATADKIRLSKQGGSFAAKNDSTSQTHQENGYYTVVLDATDTGTLGRLMVTWMDATVAAGCWTQEYEVVTANAWNAEFSTGTLPVNVTQWSGTNVATPDTAGYPKVTVKTGTGTGELDLTSGRIDADVVRWNGSTSGLTNWVKIFSTDFANLYDDVNDLYNVRLYNVSTAAGLANIADVQDECEDAIIAQKTTIADEVWVQEGDSTNIPAIKTVTDKVDTAVELDGAVYRLTTNALEQAPAPTGATDWTSGEKEQMRSALGLDGTKTTATGGQLQTVKGATDKLETTVELDGSVYKFTTNAVENAPASTGTGLTQLQRATAQGGTVNTIVLAATAATTPNIYRGNRIVIYGGTGAGQSNLIISYNGTTKVATVLLPWLVTPDATSTYEMQPGDGEVLRMLGGLWQ